MTHLAWLYHNPVSNHTWGQRYLPTIFQRWSNVICPDSQRWLNVILQDIASTLGQHFYDIRPAVTFGQNCWCLYRCWLNVGPTSVSDCDNCQTRFELTLDQRLASVGIKNRQLWPNLLLGECHINVGPTLKQWLAGYPLGQRWVWGQNYVGPTLFANEDVYCANISPNVVMLSGKLCRLWRT